MKTAIRTAFLLFIFVFTTETYVTPMPAIIDNQYVLELEQKVAEYEAQIMAYEEHMQLKDNENQQLWNFIRKTDDYEELTRIVEAEAGGESLEGKMHVASVVINRVDNGFGDTIHEVIYQPKQFSPIADGRFAKVKVSDESITATEEIIKNGSITDALYFMNPKWSSEKNKAWMQSLTYVTTIENHEFYR